MTIVPITWDDSEDIVYHVGFQVDLVEQPNAILRNMRDGSYQVNYAMHSRPQASLSNPPSTISDSVTPNSLSRVTAKGVTKEMLSLLPPRAQAAVLASNDDETAKNEWLRLVLAHTDDFVHVLSIKGQFQYVSPRVRQVLGYDAEDLLNKHISDVCHPSDLVPVMRELKDAAQLPVDGRPSQPVSMLFRVRKKRGGYVWLESNGRVQSEGRGKKSLLLSGRNRTIPTLSWKALDDLGGLGDIEVWAKISLEGLILWSSGNVEDLFGGGSSELLGKKIYSFLPQSGEAHNSAPLLAFKRAVSTSAQGLPARGATTIRLSLNGFDGRTREVVFNVFAAMTTEGSQLSESPPSMSDDTLHGSGLASPSERPPQVKCSQLLLQIKLPSNQAPPTGLSALAHPLSDHMFEEMDATRGTSWQYEVHQLKVANRKLKDDIHAFRHGAAADDGGKKRKRKRSDQEGSSNVQSSRGFDLPPGQLFKTWS